MEKHRLEYVDIKKLVPYANNARTHGPDQVAQIRKSIEEFGFVNPVLIDGDYNIIAGHGRIMAAEGLMDKVPCVFIEHLTEEQKRAYIIADNKLAENAGWDMELLKIELSELSDVDFDISLTGFSQTELSEMFTEIAVELSCAIGDKEVDGKPYSEIVGVARDYIWGLGGFEKFAEWGLVR